MRFFVVKLSEILREELQNTQGTPASPPQGKTIQPCGLLGYKDSLGENFSLRVITIRSGRLNTKEDPITCLHWIMLH